jgi:hypothetical protein
MLKPFFFICHLFFVLARTYAQNILGFVWQIHRGHSAQWQSAGFKPRDWKRVNIGIRLGMQGYMPGSDWLNVSVSLFRRKFGLQ